MSKKKLFEETHKEDTENMSQKNPSLNDWKQLYDVATEFKKIQPWTWMADADLFGVRHPKTGEIGYCCIMGELGEVFAIALYPGDQALQAYLKLQTGEIDLEDLDNLHFQTCLMASFEDRNDIDNRDYEIIKKLGLKFRGRNAWPQFRSYLPGYVPWYLTKSEAEFLTLALQQAIDVSLRARKNDDLLWPDDDDSQILVRELGRNGSWKDTYREVPFLEDEQPVFGSVNEIALQRIKKTTTQIDQIWEVGSFYFPTVVKEGGRPYFPKILFIVDHETEMALNHFLGPPQDYHEDFREALLGFLEEFQRIPAQILVDKTENQELLEPIAARLGIQLELVDWLPAVEEFREGMFEYFSGPFEDSDF